MAGALKVKEIPFALSNALCRTQVQSGVCNTQYLVGDEVVSYFKASKQWFPGVIVDMTKTKLDVQFTDGHKLKVSPSVTRLKELVDDAITGLFDQSIKEVDELLQERYGQLNAKVAQTAKLALVSPEKREKYRLERAQKQSATYYLNSKY